MGIFPHLFRHPAATDSLDLARLGSLCLDCSGDEDTRIGLGLLSGRLRAAPGFNVQGSSHVAACKPHPHTPGMTSRMRTWKAMHTRTAADAQSCSLWCASGMHYLIHGHDEVSAAGREGASHLQATASLRQSPLRMGVRKCAKDFSVGHARHVCRQYHAWSGVPIPAWNRLLPRV